MRIFHCILVAVLWVGGGASAQNKALLYDFTEVPQALMLNPGMQTGYQWYAGLPVLSGISLAAGTSGITVNDLFADDGLDFTTKVRDRAIYGMSVRDEVSSTYQVALFSGGFRGKNRREDFYSFGAYHEGDLINYWPKDLAILGYEGNANQLGRRFNLGHLKLRGEFLNVFHFGVNRKMGDKLHLGARAKIYSGILDFNSTGNRGYFVTTTGQNNLIANTLVADMAVRSSGFEAIREVLDDDTVDDGSGLRKLFTRRGFFGGDLGLGADLGFSYQLNEQTLVTGSILDLGFIYHSTDVRNFRLEGSATTEGVEVILPDALADPDADFWQDLVDEIEALVPFEEDSRSYITFRPTRLYASLRYNFGEQEQDLEDCNCLYTVSGGQWRHQYANSVGGQLYMVNRPRGPQVSLTAFYLHRFGNIVAFKGTYTVDKFSFSNIGLGMSLQAGPVNFYLMADNLLAYSNVADAHYASFQFGLNILSWGGYQD